MASQSWGQLISTIPVAGTNYTTFTTAKSMLTSATATEASSGLLTVPANFFQRGGVLEVDVDAGISWATGNTMTLQIMVGSVIAFTTGAIKVTTTGGTTIPARFQFRLTCRAMGNGTIANLMGQCTGWGRMLVPNGATPGADYSAGSGVVMAPDTTPTVGTGFDSTVANAIDFFVAMGTSSASNGFQVQQYMIKSWGQTGP